MKRLAECLTRSSSSVNNIKSNKKVEAPANEETLQVCTLQVIKTDGLHGPVWTKPNGFLDRNSSFDRTASLPPPSSDVPLLHLAHCSRSPPPGSLPSSLLLLSEPLSISVRATQVPTCILFPSKRAGSLWTHLFNPITLNQSRR